MLTRVTNYLVKTVVPARALPLTITPASAQQVSLLFLLYLLSIYCEFPLLALPDFSGVNCTEPFDPCNGTVCQNGGTCNSIHNGHYFQCMCPPSHTGQWCEELLLEEPSNCSCPSCQSCLTNGSSSTCQCLSGCVGEQCEIVDTCGSLLPCSNHTQAPHCLNTNLISTGYVCTCAEGWGGPTCQYEVNECSPSPCNAGECVALPGGFQCNCPDGTTGNFCDSEREGTPNNII